VNTNNIEPDLETRISARCTELIRKLDELEADTRIECTVTRAQLVAMLSKLRNIIKEGLVDGWASLADQVGIELDHWLAESASQLELSTKDRQS
jgi:hypothetical protein